MRNEDKMAFAVMGTLFGGMVGVVMLPLFLLAQADPILWFCFTMCLLAPAGAAVGWNCAQQLEDWLNKGDKN